MSADDPLTAESVADEMDVPDVSDRAIHALPRVIDEGDKWVIPFEHRDGLKVQFEIWKDEDRAEYVREDGRIEMDRTDAMAEMVGKCADSIAEYRVAYDKAAEQLRKQH